MKALPIAIMSMFLNVSYAQETDTTKTFVQSKELDEVKTHRTNDMQVQPVVGF